MSGEDRRPRGPDARGSGARSRVGLLFAFVALAAAVATLLALRGGDEEPGRSLGATSTRSSPSTASRREPTRPPARVPAGAPGAHRAPDEAVPILMYHVINEPPPGTAQPELWVSRSDLAAQVTMLARRGFHGVTLQQVYDAWHAGGRLPAKPIVLSFDDGYHSDFTNALPVLRRQGWPGVLNLQVDLVKTDLPPPEVRALIEAGWEVDAHTFTHPDLTTLDAAQLRREVAGSRQALRRMFGVPVNFFCYPAGRYDARVVAAVRAAGYLGATTTEPGLAAPGQPSFALKRIRVNGSDGVEGLEESLRSAGALG